MDLLVLAGYDSQGFVHALKRSCLSLVRKHFSSSHLRKKSEL
jgi:hypothetical protein